MEINVLCVIAKMNEKTNDFYKNQIKRKRIRKTLLHYKLYIGLIFITLFYLNG